MTPPTDEDRIKGLIEEHRSSERRFQGYHNTDVSWGRPSQWDARAAAERRIADDLSALLSRLAAAEQRNAKLFAQIEALVDARDKEEAETQAAVFVGSLDAWFYLLRDAFP